MPPRCDGCGRAVSPAGGIANVWSFDERAYTEGTALTVEFEDGRTRQVCFACLEALPADPAPEDIDTLDGDGRSESESDPERIADADGDTG